MNHRITSFLKGNPRQRQAECRRQFGIQLDLPPPAPGAMQIKRPLVQMRGIPLPGPVDSLTLPGKHF
jgi:hypothetical protein